MNRECFCSLQMLLLLDIGTDAFCMSFLWIFFFISFPTLLGILLLKPAAAITLISHEQKRSIGIFFQLWKDCKYRGADLNPFKFEEDIFMYRSYLKEKLEKQSCWRKDEDHSVV